MTKGEWHRKAGGNKSHTIALPVTVRIGLAQLAGPPVTGLFAEPEALVVAAEAVQGAAAAAAVPQRLLISIRDSFSVVRER
jgi:hypothetical protein